MWCQEGRLPLCSVLASKTVYNADTISSRKETVESSCNLTVSNSSPACHLGFDQKKNNNSVDSKCTSVPHFSKLGQCMAELLIIQPPVFSARCSLVQNETDVLRNEQTELHQIWAVANHRRSRMHIYFSFLVCCRASFQKNSDSKATVLKN